MTLSLRAATLFSRHMLMLLSLLVVDISSFSIFRRCPSLLMLSITSLMRRRYAMSALFF